MGDLVTSTTGLGSRLNKRLAASRGSAGRRQPDAAQPVGRARRRADGCARRGERSRYSASPCPDNRYPSVGARHPAAIRLERAIRDLFGLEPEGLTDTRPWLDHGRWAEEQAPAASYPFLPVEGEALHQIPVGPVHAGIIEPGHFRFTCDGETVVRLEERLGYVHKGIDLLMSGAKLSRAARLGRAGLRRQHRGLCVCVRSSRRKRARYRAARAGGMAAGGHGGTGAARQPHRRFRRDLQRCLLQHHARPLRGAARKNPAGRLPPASGIG